jgi:hypothetical protein
MIIMKFRLCKTQLKQLEEEGRQGKWEQTGNMMYICLPAGMLQADSKTVKLGEGGTG